MSGVCADLIAILIKSMMKVDNGGECNMFIIVFLSVEAPT
jgi:hypothetical protein